VTVSRSKSRDEEKAPVRDRAARAYEAARERTASAYETARSRAGEVTRQASEQMTVYPVAAVIGGFLVGAIAAALLPRTERETRLLGDTGKRLTGAAREAAQRGIETGKAQIGELRANAAQKVSEAVGEAVSGVVAGHKD